MRSSLNPYERVWLLLLALLVCLSEILAWWWASQSPGAESLQGSVWLGLSSALGGLAACALLWRHTLAAKQETKQIRQLLVSSLDTLDVGLEIWDEQDRLVFYNKKTLLYSDFHSPADIGQSFETLMRAKLKRQLVPAAIGREQAWLTQRMATRGSPRGARLLELAGKQWHNQETRTPEGYLVTVWVDVTELVRKSKELEISNLRLAQLSRMDELTGVANRRCFFEALTTEWQRGARGGTLLSLLMVDIDHFKNFNDHYGHLAGDECLRRVAKVLEQCVRRAGELVARYGGEEFVLLLPNADLEQARETAQKCLAQMQQEHLAHAASPTAALVTISIGVACVLPDAQQNPATLVNAADAAMYRAKSGGRARYEVADQSDWSIDKDTPRTRPVPLQ